MFQHAASYGRLCLLAGFTSAFAALGPSAWADVEARLVLSHLPLKTSRAYHSLLRAAGDPKREILPMTKAEIWLVRADRVATLRAQAQDAGVGVTAIAEDQVDALVPMQSDHMTSKQSEMMKDAMSDRASMGVSMMAAAAPETLEYALIRAADQDGKAPIRIKLSPEKAVVANRTGLVREGERYVWQGEIAGTFEPVTLVYWASGGLSGTVQHAGRIFKVQPLGDGAIGVIETAPAMLPPEHAPAPMQQNLDMQNDPLMMQGDATPLMNKLVGGESIEHLRDAAPTKMAVALAPSNITIEPAGKSTGTQAATTITLIIAYTRAAARHYADISKDLITLAVAEANQSFVRSGIRDVRLEVVHDYEVDYVEQGTHFEHMFRFAEKKDGFADEIHALRDKYRADVAVMIVSDSNGCGLSAGISPPAERAFAVVHHGCAAATYSLAHEIGHIIGARHDTGYDDNATPFPFGHGYVNGVKWRTMMSYEQSCGGCPRLAIWSNPEIKFHGDAAGNELANNARVIREGAKRVASFR